MKWSALAIAPLTVGLATALPGLVDGPYGTPVIGTAAAQLPDGRILLWAALGRYDFTDLEDGAGQTYTAIFDPDTGMSTEALIEDTNHDMFCPGTVRLPDGKILITGGTKSKRATLYDPETNSWSTAPEMIIARGYHSMTPLSDGTALTFGGSWSGGVGGKDGEIWKDGGWVLKPGIFASAIKTGDFITAADNHIWLFQAPDGRVFQPGPSRLMHWIDVTGIGTIVPAGLRDEDEDAMCGNAVMYDIGKILTLGGAIYYEVPRPSSKRAYAIDINGDEPVVERVDDMTYGRIFSNSIVLPSGEVMVVGGMTVVELFSDENPVMYPEIWNPQTKRFTLVDAPLTIPRTYHSTGLLLQDGRVLVAGGGLCGDECGVNHPDAEIITPPYLLNEDGSPAVRPKITWHSSQVFSPGGQIIATMDTVDDHTFALIRLGAVTHTTNNDQRRIPLEVLGKRDDEFTLDVPSNPNIVLPGDYWLFGMNSDGVPSMGIFLRRSLPDDPGACAPRHTDCSSQECCSGMQCQVVDGQRLCIAPNEVDAFPGCCTLDFMTCLPKQDPCSEVLACGYEIMCMDYHWNHNGAQPEGSCAPRFSECGSSDECCPGMACSDGMCYAKGDRDEDLSGEPCCTSDFQACVPPGSFCASEDTCTIGLCSPYHWNENGEQPEGTCVARLDPCTRDSDCCEPLVCEGDPQDDFQEMLCWVPNELPRIEFDWSTWDGSTVKTDTTPTGSCTEIYDDCQTSECCAGLECTEIEDTEIEGEILCLPTSEKALTTPKTPFSFERYNLWPLIMRRTPLHSSDVARTNSD